MRYPLVDGHGNFGNIDGYSAAAMRYTEARLDRLATEMLRDIDADTVDFVAHLRRQPAGAGRAAGALPEPARQRQLGHRGRDGHEHPAAQPARGDRGDDRLHRRPEHRRRRADEAHQGPGLPDRRARSSAARASATPTRPAAGAIRVQAKAHIEPIGQGKEAIIVTELPYQVRKGGDGGLILKIRDLVHDKKIPEITDLRDESDRHGMRIVIELKRDAIPKVVLNKLYKHTPMQTTFGVNMVALVDNVPRTLSLREVIGHYVDHQREVIVRRTKYELRRAEERAHVLEGQLIALDNLDEVIALIRGSRDPEAARDGPGRALRAHRGPGAGDPPADAEPADRARGRQDQAGARRPRRADQGAARDPRRREPGLRADQGRAAARSPRPTATSGAPRSPTPRARSTSRT